MKHTLLLLCALLLASIEGQAQNNKFFEEYPFHGLVEQVNDTYIVCGSNSSGSAWAITDSTGKIISEKQYRNCYFENERFLPDKGLIAAGSFHIPTYGSSDSIFLIRLDSMGNVVWSKIYYSSSLYNLSSSSNPTFVSLSNLGGFWITGLANTSSSENMEYVIRTDATGNILSAETVSSGSISSWAYGSAGPMIETVDNTCYFTFSYNAVPYPPLMAIFKTDSALHFKWVQTIYYGNAPTTSDCIIARNNYLYLTYGTPQYMGDETVAQSINLVKLDSSCSNVKLLKIEPETWGQGNTVHFMPNEHIIFGGASGNGYAIGQGFLAETDTSLNLIWSKEYAIFSSPNNTSTVEYVRPTKDKGFIASAYGYLFKTDSTGNSNCHDSLIALPVSSSTGLGSSVLAMKFDTVTFNTFSMAVSTTNNVDTVHTYCYLYTGVNEITESKNIVSLYPDPNNGSFGIDINNGDIKTQLTIYNVLGQRVYQSIMNNGANYINIGAQPTGLYLYRIIDLQGKLVDSGKLIIR